MKNTRHLMEAAENMNDQMKDAATELKDKAVETAEQGNEKISHIAEKTASVTPTLLFAAAALLSIVVSLTLQIRGKRQWSLFIGHWAPSFLLFGLYNKLSKTVGAA